MVISPSVSLGNDTKTVDGQSSIVKLIDEYNIGGVILFDYDFHKKVYDKNIDNPTQVKRLTKALQFYTQKSQTLRHRPLLPLFISVDYEGGNVTRLNERYGFPSTPSVRIPEDSNT